MIPRTDKRGPHNVKLISPILELTTIFELSYVSVIKIGNWIMPTNSMKFKVQKLLSSILNADVHFYEYHYLKITEKKISYAVQKSAV